MQVSVETPPITGLAPRTPRRRRSWKIALICAVAATVIAAGVFRYDWPFRHAALLGALQQQSGMRVQIGSFRRTYFPNPGCVAGSISFYRSGVERPLLTINQLIIRGSYSGLLTHRISESHSQRCACRNSAPVGKLARSAGNQSWLLPFRPDDRRNCCRRHSDRISSYSQGRFLINLPGSKAEGAQLADGKPLGYETLLHIPEASGRGARHRKVWSVADGQCRTNSGFRQILGAESGPETVFDGVDGDVSASGSFSGILQHIEAEGTTDVPAFSVRSSGHRVHVVGRYRAIVNGLNGDTDFSPAVTHFGKTTMASSGPSPGRAISRQAKQCRSTHPPTTPVFRIYCGCLCGPLRHR